MKPEYLTTIPLLGLLALATIAGAQSPRSLNHQGVQAYTAKKYDEAAQHFEKAREAAGDDALTVEYNAGAAKAAAGKTDDALKDFTKVDAARDPDLSSRARFAEGVVLYDEARKKSEAGKVEDAIKDAKAAIEANRSVLEANGNDNDARVNYELSSLLAQELEKRMKQQQQQNKDQNKQDQNKDQQKQQQQDQQNMGQQKQDQQKQDEQKKNEQDKNQQPQATPTPQSGQNGQASPSPSPTPSSQDQAKQQQQQNEQQKDKQRSQQSQQQLAEKSKEQQEKDAATSVLNLIDENDEKALKRMMKLQYGNLPQPEKDW